MRCIAKRIGGFTAQKWVFQSSLAKRQKSFISSFFIIGADNILDLETLMFILCYIQSGMGERWIYLFTKTEEPVFGFKNKENVSVENTEFLATCKNR